MITLYTAISDLLFLHDAVVVPGLGKFQCQSQGAQVNVVTNQFVRPTVKVSFDPDTEEDDKLVGYLCEQNQLTDNEAKSMLNQFVAELNKALQEGEEISFPEIGVLSMSQTGEFSFEQTESLLADGDAFGLGDFTPTPVFTAEAQNDWKKRLAEEQWDKIRRPCMWRTKKSWKPCAVVAEKESGERSCFPAWGFWPCWHSWFI